MTSVTIILLEKLFRRTSPSFKQIFFVKDQTTLTQVKITTKHISNRLVTFVTHKCFAVLFFPPSCCVSSLLTTRGVDSGTRKRESMGKKTWLGHAALSCDYNARNWKTSRENYLKLKWIVFPFSNIVTLPVSVLIGPLQQVIHVIQNRHTGKQQKQWGKASYIYVNYYGCCIILFVFTQVCRVWDIVTFFWLNFVTVTCVV